MNPQFFEDRKTDEIDWSAIREYRRKGDLANLVMALIESNKLFKKVLKEQGAKGRGLNDQIISVRERLTQLDSLLLAIEVYRKVINKYGSKPSKQEIKKAISAYQQAIYDLTSETDYSPPNLFAQIKSWIEVNLILNDRKRNKFSIYFLLLVVFILVLDNTHFGQKFLSWLTNLIGQVFVIGLAVLLALILVVLFLSGLIKFFEERK